MTQLSIILFFISLVVSVTVLSPKLREPIQKFLVSQNKEILSQLETTRGDKVYKVIKARTPRGLLVELFRMDGDQAIFLDSSNLTDKKDAYYRFNEDRYNLFLKDINGDGFPEIILPSLDKNMKARLNIFSLDTDTEKLLKITQH